MQVAISFAGNLTSAPELRFGNNGAAVAKFTVAVNHSKLDRQTGQWVEQETAFYRCTAFGQLAENLTESAGKGDRVCVIGRQEYRTWLDEKTGEKRGAFQVIADEVGASLTWARAALTKTGKHRDDAPPPSDDWASASATRPEQAPF